ncbi:MAG: type II toxin-antitoxin system VapC family toxin [Desulfobacula sp.]|jgi:PIN domain nuclease of toxin-antitoxin system|uniref:type II toxin-antitoxin system VapC family toxin n=1 Tax=Desulfobacula sp. TaxID=2593537 RepID=UPI001EC3C846|nr:type II toxin-antitoxin system VapC family toxin [Desulfobacula sp.]MBT4876745.1 type II toxin-antitoxin system VapC family toxin [Desulfobacula sp.]MBT5546536.1 type II toxin-antitoxin system VapC family toxin [Desulfobacula sp.]
MSAIMLDTCGLIWLVNGGCKISEETLKSIEQANVVYVSAATALEVGCKAAIKKLELPMDAEKWYSKALSIHDLVEIPITGKIALFSASLPFIHKDPADRIIIATAILNRLPIVTHDSRFNQYSVEVLR